MIASYLARQRAVMSSISEEGERPAKKKPVRSSLTSAKLAAIQAKMTTEAQATAKRVLDASFGSSPHRPYDSRGARTGHTADGQVLDAPAEDHADQTAVVMPRPASFEILVRVTLSCLDAGNVDARAAVAADT
jgi:hypothetical protein